MGKNKQLKLGALLSYISIFINIGAGMLYTPWMVQKIGQSQYGLYTLANSLIALFLVDFGLSAATARYISKYRAEGNQEKINNFLGAIYKLYLMITAVMFTVFVVLFFFIDGIYSQLTQVEIQQFKIVYIIAATFSVLNFPFITFNGILTSYEKFIQLKLADIIYRVSYVLGTIVALLCGRGLYALVSIHAGAGLLITLYKFIIIRKEVPVKVNFKHSDLSMYKEIFSFSLWVTISSLAQRLIFNVTPSILGIVASTSAIAVFGIVTTIESYTYTITTAINGMFMPKISQILVNDETKLTPLLLKVGRFLYIINGIIIAGFAVAGKSFIQLWMGIDYIDAYWGILLVTIPGLFYNSLQIANTTMIATKKVNIQAYVNITIGLVNVIFSFILSNFFGVIGSCISIFVAYMIRAIILNIIYHKILPFNMIEFAYKCYFKMSMPVILSIVCGLIINYFVKEISWTILAGKIAIIIMLYMLFVLIIGLNKYERVEILDTFKGYFLSK